MNFTEIFNGMVGKDFISAFNDNFRITNNTFLDILATLLYKVKSTDIKEFKVIDGVVSYTLEELEEGEEDNRSWTPVDITRWGNINGNLEDQSDLKEALDSKAAADVVSEIDNILSTLRLEFNNLRNDYEDTEITVEANKNDIADLKEVDKTKVSSNNIKGIRVNDAEFQWTLDGITWYAMPKTTSISWGNLTGDISLQDDLMALFRNINTNVSALDTNVSDLTNLVNSKVSEINALTQAVNDLSSDLTDLSNSTQTGFNNMSDDIDQLDIDLDTHTSDQNNPHNVTKEQVGLGLVDNTSDMDKPLSTDQKTYIDEQIASVEEDISNFDNKYPLKTGVVDSLFVGTTSIYNELSSKVNVLAFIIYSDYNLNVLSELIMDANNTNYKLSNNLTIENVTVDGKYSGKTLTSNIDAQITGETVTYQNIPEGNYKINNAYVATNDGINNIDVGNFNISGATRFNIISRVLEGVTDNIEKTNLWYESGITITSIVKSDDPTNTLEVLETLPDAPKQDYTCIRLGKTDGVIDLGTYTVSYLDEGISKTQEIEIIGSNIFVPIIISKEVS